MFYARVFENIEYYTSRKVCELEPFSSGPFMIAVSTAMAASMPDLTMPK
jgi:hypothetical protein